ncbi:2,3-bisphosphoglycerate-dependent phosphoglycerate mutase [Paenibacillus cellulosilyticus]|uniref:2,3-bisphosphoglycerate-dependent phosphoglycerate mutase n=1 Tax=Paenibacillus cellulosilyticus TaxID=375489 RepID=A0A2V2YQH1_9BACL|nr:histidine phosphatase family protein [Paenibacillus cellulosilyticus]PWV98676.1 2,3-bisphosphoglycerate-dependent phosphoglycerate mutase [Paenibacillus cellulosilyticus]QKS43819.1 histidine phosphatase family protein [Paenibacillus cellulosilyticus]
MTTYVYMVRHGQSPLTEGTERTRGLTDKGMLDASRITELLKSEGIEVFVSSPYQRAILTIQELAHDAGQEIIVYENLKEQHFSSTEIRMPDVELLPLLQQCYADPTFARPDGESNADCQQRAVTVLQELLTTYQGRKIVIGTHGAVMALMMGYYDRKYDLAFMLNTSKPDVYRMKFEGHTLLSVKRIWGAK